MAEASAIAVPSVADHALVAVGRKILRLVEPTEAPVLGEPPAGKYCSVMHAELVRMKVLGLSDREAAQSVGISAETLRRWRVRHPKLNYDLDQAFDLSTAQAAAILRKLMEGDGATAFNAVKFFLTTHSPAFKETQKLEVTVGVDETVQSIRTGEWDSCPWR